LSSKTIPEEEKPRNFPKDSGLADNVSNAVSPAILPENAALTDKVTDF
jgi:hypothetical protein